MSEGGGGKPGDRTQYFAKFPQVLWDLGLVQRFLPERQDVLGLLAMLRYADFTTGECTVFTGKPIRETGVTQPDRAAIAGVWHLLGLEGRVCAASPSRWGY